jgi:hypothetical protein
VVRKVCSMNDDRLHFGLCSEGFLHGTLGVVRPKLG